MGFTADRRQGITTALLDVFNDDSSPASGVQVFKTYQPDEIAGWDLLIARLRGSGFPSPEMYLLGTPRTAVGAHSGQFGVFSRSGLQIPFVPVGGTFQLQLINASAAGVPFGDWGWDLIGLSGMTLGQWARFSAPTSAGFMTTANPAAARLVLQVVAPVPWIHRQIVGVIECDQNHDIQITRTFNNTTAGSAPVQVTQVIAAGVAAGATTEINEPLGGGGGDLEVEVVNNGGVVANIRYSLRVTTYDESG